MSEISVIIPVYNVSSKLKRCLVSLQNQTFSNFEVILINDGSIDNSGEICDHFVSNDKRFKVFHKKNGGVSIARNFGLEKANGEFICFVDSDDEVLENYLQDLLDDFNEAENTELVFQGVKRYRGDDLHSSTEIENEVVSVTDYEKLFEKHKISLNGNPVSKLFLTKIIRENRLKFNDKFCYNEDKIFILEYLLLCKGQVVFSNKNNYKYYVNSGSLTNKLLKPEDYFLPYLHFKYLIKDQFRIDFSDKRFAVVYQNFKIYLHMYMNSVFIKHKNNEAKYLKNLSIEDWEIYKFVSKNYSGKGRKLFDFFLLRRNYFIPRIIANKLIAPYFK